MPPMFRPLEFYVGSRYVWSRRRRGLVSFMSAASLCGVALGVASLIIVLSIMNGLETETRDRLLSMNSHATFAAADDSIVEWSERAALLDTFPGVEHIAPFVSIEGMLAVGDRLYPSLIRGVDPLVEADAFPEDNMVEGSFIDLADNRDGIVIGRVLANNLGVTLGDQITLLHARIEDAQPRPSLVPLRIVGVFSARIADHDAGLALIHIDRAERLAGGASARSLGVRVEEPLRIAALRSFSESQPALSGLAYSDWSEEHRSHFRAIRIEKTMISLMLMLIVAIAAFNIVASLMMVVNSKSTDIAIMRTLGLEPRRVAGIFMFQGSIIGVAGTLIGTFIGVLIAVNISVIVPRIEALLGFQIMPADVYYISQIPSELHWFDVIWIDVAAFAVALLATLYPSRRAARIAPAAALRYE
jgi:lipoprotein-releasing system permease protein